MGSISMEPKSIAFYTAVAVSILAVLSATTFPTMAQAQEVEDNEEDRSQVQEEDGSQVQEEEDETMNEPERGTSEGGATNSNNDGTGRQGQDELSLASTSGVVTCGQTITEDVTLTSDLNCSSGDGLIVGASGITINLNGYKITAGEDASSSGSSIDYDGSSGILVANVDDVSINGLGEISYFDKGVTFMGSSGSQIADVQLANNRIGALITGSEHTEISRATMTSNEYALISDSSNGAAVAFNQVVANTKQGFLFEGSDDNVIAANNMFGNGENGIYLDIMSNGNMVDYNTAFGHNRADLNNADGQPINVNQNTFGEHNNCGISLPGGLCR